MSADPAYIALNTTERERLRALAARLSDDDLSRPLGPGWTVAAALAHLAWWDRRALALLEKWEREGVGPSPTDEDVLNEATRTLCLAIPPRTAAHLAVGAAEAVDRKLEAFAPALAAEVLAAGSPINLSRAAHRREHLDQIERALAG